MPKKEDEDNSSIADDSFDEEKEPRKKPSKEKKTRKVHRNKNKRRERQADEPHDNSEPNAQTPSALPSTQYLSHPTVLAGRSSLSSSASRAADLRSPTTSLQHEPNLYRTTLDATSTTLRDNLRLNHLSNEQLLQLVMAHERLLQQQSSPIPSLMRNSTIDHLLLSATTHLPLLQQQHRYATLGLLFDSDSSTPTTTRSSSLLKGLARFHSGTSFK